MGSRLTLNRWWATNLISLEVVGLWRVLWMAVSSHFHQAGSLILLQQDGPSQMVISGKFYDLLSRLALGGRSSQTGPYRLTTIGPWWQVLSDSRNDWSWRLLRLGLVPGSNDCSRKIILLTETISYLYRRSVPRVNVPQPHIYIPGLVSKQRRSQPETSVYSNIRAPRSYC